MLKKLKYFSAIIFLAAVVLLGFSVVQNRIRGKQHIPEILINGDLIEVSVKDEENELLKGVTAIDAEDGDLTGSVIVESIGRFNEDSQRKVTYAVIDSSNNVTHAERYLKYRDYTDPRFVIKHPLSFQVGTKKLTSDIKAIDCIEGDISGSIRLLSEKGINTEASGKYDAELRITNSAGRNCSLPVVIEIYDNPDRSSLPRINLKEYVAYIAKNESFEPLTYLESVTVKGTDFYFTYDKSAHPDDEQLAFSKDNTINYEYVDVQSNVDVNKPGNYEVQYTIEDSDCGTGTATLYVVVTEG